MTLQSSLTHPMLRTSPTGARTWVEEGVAGNKVRLYEVDWNECLNRPAVWKLLEETTTASVVAAPLLPVDLRGTP